MTQQENQLNEQQEYLPDEVQEILVEAAREAMKDLEEGITL